MPVQESQDEQELKALMRAARAGSPEAARKLLMRTQELLKPFVKNILTRAGLAGHGPEEDVLQDALLGIHTKRATYREGESYLAWMYAIARYKTIDYLRFAKVRKHDELSDTLEAPWEDPGSKLDIEQLLEQLPPKQRQVIRLMKLEGLSTQETSLKTGISPADVRVSVHRGLKALKKALGGSS